MSETRNVFLLILILLIVTLVSTGIAIRMLYTAAIEQQKARLIESAQSSARMIEAMAEHDRKYGHLIRKADETYNPVAASLDQIEKAHSRFKGFGETGEFTLAKLEEDQIIFLLSHRHFDLNNPLPVSLNSDLSEPMKLALEGKSGTVVGKDYRGEKVLAAYEPVKILDLGIVVKIDVAEIREPFKKAAIYSGVAGLILIVFGSIFFVKITMPLFHKLAESEERFRSTFEQAAVGIVHVDPAGPFLRVNKKFCEIIGSSRDELLQKTFQDITHPDDLEADLEYVRQLAAGKIATYSMEKR